MGRQHENRATSLTAPRATSHRTHPYTTTATITQIVVAMLFDVCTERAGREPMKARSTATPILLLLLHTQSPSSPSSSIIIVIIHHHRHHHRHHHHQSSSIIIHHHHHHHHHHPWMDVLTCPPRPCRVADSRHHIRHSFRCHGCGVLALTTTGQQ